MKQIWPRSVVLALAQQGCVFCMGSGIKVKVTCGCVFREIFRQCYARYQICAANPPRLTHQRLSPGKGRREGHSTMIFCRADAEYMADFILVAKRLLSAEQFRIFQMHFLHGQTWRVACGQLKIDRGTFFHQVYRAEESLGKGFGELKPHALWPVDEYFGKTPGNVFSFSGPESETSLPPLKFPLQQKAQ